MAILNSAFETLSVPAKRREHDQWIAAAERKVSAEQIPQQNSTASPRNRSFTVDETKLHRASKPTQSPRKVKLVFIRMLLHILRNWFWYGIGAIALVGWVNDKPKPPPSPKPYVSAPAPASVPSRYVPFKGQLDSTPGPKRARAYVRSVTAPNGQPWPISSAYIRGYKRLHSDGLSTVTIDNSQNDSDVFIKLVSLNGQQAYPVRMFFVSGHGSFTLNKVTAGSYDVRYRDLSTGGLSRSESFVLKETPTDDSTVFSNVTMTLYKVRNGNMQTYDLAEDEF